MDHSVFVPTQKNQLMGHEKAIEQIQYWFEQKLYKQGKALLLHGPCGCGKTTVARVLAREFGFTHILEWGANCARDKETLKKSVGEMTQSYNFSFRPSLLLLDELDGDSFDSASDSQGLSYISKLIQQSKIPILCICQDLYHPKLKNIRFQCECVALKTLSPNELYPLASFINDFYRIGLKDDMLRKNILALCRGDFRQLFFLLDMAWIDRKKSTKLISCTNTNTNTNSKDTSDNIFTMATRLFSAFQTTSNSGRRLPSLCSDLQKFTLEELTTQQFMIQESLPHAADNIEQLSDALEIFSETDGSFEFASLVQDEDLLEAANIWLGILYPFVSLAGFKSKSLFGKIQFPSALKQKIHRSDPFLYQSLPFKRQPVTLEHKESLFRVIQKEGFSTIGWSSEQHEQFIKQEYYTNPSLFPIEIEPQAIEIFESLFSQPKKRAGSLTKR